MKRKPELVPKLVKQLGQDLVISRRSLIKMGVVTLAATGLTTTPALRAGSTPLGFCPVYGLSGTPIKLFGPDFGANVADLSVRLVDSGHFGFVMPLDIQNGELETSISAVPRTLGQAKFQVVWGTGSHVIPSNLPPELTLTEPIRVWIGNGGNRCDSFQLFTLPWYSASSGNCHSFWGGLAAGYLSVDIVLPYNEDCCPICPSGTRMSLRLYGSTAGTAFECEYQATLINTTPLGTPQIADALCTILRSAFNSEFGVDLDCYQTDIDPTRSNISVGAPAGAPFTLGSIHIDLRHDQESLSSDSIDCESISSNCDSMNPSCPSINVDFFPFIFS